MGTADRPMTCSRAEQSSSTKNMAQPRRRNPLPAAPARSELPDPIRRPALVLVGRGAPSRARVDALPEQFLDFVAIPASFAAQLEAEAA